MADEAYVRDTKCKWRSSCWFECCANCILLKSGKRKNCDLLRVLSIIKERENEILPHEVKMLINEHRQKKAI